MSFFQNDYTGRLSSKDTYPWITLNGRDFSDSQFSIDAIKEHFNIENNSFIDLKQQSTAHVIQRMTDEAFYW